MHDDADDLLAQFRADPAKIAGPGGTKFKVRKPTERFVKVPLWWAEAAAKAIRYPGLLVLVELLHIHWKTQSTTVSLPNGRLKSLGVSREVKRRVLRDLERAGLIRVERRPNRNPLVTLIAF